MMQKKQENEFANFVPSLTNKTQGEHGSLQINAYNPGYENAMAILSETIGETIYNVLQSRNAYPVTQERISRLDFGSATNMDVKFDNDMIKAELDIQRVGGEPIHITAILSPGHDSINIGYPNGQFSHIDRNGRDFMVSEA